MSLFTALLLGMVTLKLAHAGFLRDTTQHSTDAAALAGAKAAKEQYLDSASEPFSTTDQWRALIGTTNCSPFGQADAATLATANGATLRTYCLDTINGEVRVTTTTTTTNSNGQTAQSQGTAGYRTNPYTCELAISPTPPQPTPPTHTPNPTLTPEPPSFTDGALPHLDCDGTQIPLRFATVQPGPLPRYVIKDPLDLESLLEEQLLH